MSIKWIYPGEKTMKKTLSTAVWIAALMIAGCSDDDEICERPSEARQIVSDSQIEQFQEAGVDFFCGDDPPSIAGVYERGRREGFVEYHDDERIVGERTCGSTIYIEATEESNVYEISSESSDCNSSSESRVNYVSGQGDCFTLYNESEGQFQGCETAGIGIFSGCLAEGGIENPRWASLATKREGDNCQSLYEQRRTSLEGQIDVLATHDEWLPRIDD